MSFNYKDGKDYTCRLCGEAKHTLGPRPDGLCDSCWELEARVKAQPLLAHRVLASLPIAFSFIANAVGPQSPEQTLLILTYELGKVIEYRHKANCYGETGYYCVANQQKEMSDLISMARYYCEQRGWDYLALVQLGEQAYLERMEDLKKYGLKGSTSL